jgi:hypothetical protein
MPKLVSVMFSTNRLWRIYEAGECPNLQSEEQIQMHRQRWLYITRGNSLPQGLADDSEVGQMYPFARFSERWFVGNRTMYSMDLRLYTNIQS